MPRTVTVTFSDGTRHVYQNVPDNATPDQVQQRVARDFEGKTVSALDGGRKAAQPAPRPTVGNALAQAANTTAQRVTEGMAAPLEMLSAPGRLVNRGLNRVIGGVGDAVLRGLGMNEPANALKSATQSADRGYANARPVTTITERNAPLNQRTGGAMGDFVGQMAGGMLLPVPGGLKPRPKLPTPRPANAAREVVQQGQRAGVRVMTTDVRPPRTFVGKTAQATGERVIGMGTGSVRQAQQAERIQAVKNLAAEFNVVDDGAGVVDDVAADLAKTRGGMLEKLTTAKSAVINQLDGATVPAPQAVKAIDDQIARLSGINKDAFAPVIAKLENFKGELVGGKSLSQIEGNRRLLGDLFSDPSLAAIKGDGQKALNAIYGPLRSDMGNFIKANGGNAAFSRWKGANDRLAAMAGELDDKAFKGILAKSDTTPEAVANMLFSKTPSSVRRLYSNLSGEGRAKAQSAIMARAIEKAGGLDNLSPDRFAGEVGRLGKSVGVFFQGDDLARVEGLSRVLAATKRAAEASVAPPTGVQNAMAGLYGGAGVFGGLQGLLAVQGYGLLARAYESAAVRNALLKLSRAPAGSKAEGMMLERAAAALSAQIGRLSESRVGAAMNDNVGIPAAAGDGQENQGEQQPPLEP